MTRITSVALKSPGLCWSRKKLGRSNKGVVGRKPRITAEKSCGGVRRTVEDKGAEVVEVSRDSRVEA
jgi:hypothetical protein